MAGDLQSCCLPEPQLNSTPFSTIGGTFQTIEGRMFVAQSLLQEQHSSSDFGMVFVECLTHQVATSFGTSIIDQHHIPGMLLAVAKKPFELSDLAAQPRFSQRVVCRG